MGQKEIIMCIWMWKSIPAQEKGLRQYRNLMQEKGLQPCGTLYRKALLRCGNPVQGSAEAVPEPYAGKRAAAARDPIWGKGRDSTEPLQEIAVRR